MAARTGKQPKGSNGRQTPPTPTPPPAPGSAREAAEVANATGPTGEGKLPVFSPEKLIENYGDKGPFNYPLCCPSCAGEFIAGPFQVPPSPQQPMQCGMCLRGGIPFESMRRGFENTQKFYGDPIDCPRPGCHTKYQPIMEGNSGYDPKTGKGGMRRACPKCGWYSGTVRAVPNTLESRETDLRNVLV